MIRLDHQTPGVTTPGRTITIATVAPALLTWLVVPTLWLSVWCLACVLHAWNSAGVAPTDRATLGWLPSLLASLMTSLYLSSRMSLRPSVAQAVGHSIAAVIVVVFLGTQVYLGGWMNGLLVLAVYIASELQTLLHQRSSPPQTSDHSKGDPLVSDASPNESEVQSPEANDARNSCDVAGGSFTPSNQRSVHVAAEATAPRDPVVSENPISNLDNHGPNQNELGVAATRTEYHGIDECETEEECETESQSESSLPCDRWLQQMTRSHYEPDSSDAIVRSDNVKLERVEWFYRHRWETDEVQVELHCVFQPPFTAKPQMQVQVVEGAGEVTIGDGLAHGTRLQLKRRLMNESSNTEPEPYSVVWLEAIGPVE
ncbi:MAG: hypothetical protein JNL67_05485 [Planctomycetaceae bacterium]|nr:hypothetical protein [Planctomycetaceae bacterium]